MVQYALLNTQSEASGMVCVANMVGQSTSRGEGPYHLVPVDAEPLCLSHCAFPMDGEIPRIRVDRNLADERCLANTVYLLYQ